VIVNMGVDDPESIPVRDAATVMLVRDSSHGVEVFMLRRNLNSDFVGGAYVFPGGGVDLADGHDDLEDLCDGLADADASRQLELDSGGLAFYVAAIRESFEEAGLLSAVAAGGDPVRFDDAAVAERFARHREEVDNGRMTMSELCRAEGIRLCVGGLGYFSRWITPLGAPRRYDTRFFVAHPPEGQTPVHDDREVIANLWIRPAEALERHAAGEFELIFPTVRSLEDLCRFDRAEDVVRHAQTLDVVEAVLPLIVDGDHGMRIVLPGDLEFDALTSQPITGA
jgi:8-oxo-dGTP pyrophosphatase MutT (NUDIX family)